MTVKNPQLIPLFNKIKRFIEPYSKYFNIVENEAEYGLVYNGQIEFDKFKRDEVYFCGIIIQKHYVGFYFMPQYTTNKGPEYFSGPDFLKLLKGKSCYYITEKSFTKKVQDELKQALKKGLESYKNKEWIKI
jgi:hypothetical protein